MGYEFTNEGLKVLMDRFVNDSPTREEPTQFSVGTGTTTAMVTDTALANAIPFNTLESVDDMDVITGWTDSADCTLSVNSTTLLDGSGALNFTKDGTASTVCSSSKTVTSRDYTSKWFNIFIYVKDAAMLAKLTTTALNLRYGSDSSNYYQFDIAKSTLTTGWNFISKQSTDADSTTGSPTIASMDYLELIFNSTATGDTWVDGDLVVENASVGAESTFYKDYEATYPTIDETNFQITIRSRLSTVQANGHLISEYGAFNEDATRKMITRVDFTGFSKTNTDELILQEKILFSNTNTS